MSPFHCEPTIAILKPNPGSPSRFSFGILQSSNIRLPVDVALIPNLSSFFPKLSPAIGFGTRKALIPCKWWVFSWARAWQNQQNDVHQAKTVSIQSDQSLRRATYW